ncbi:hypothetical protein PIB30_008518 [Stylosanthes scabra]|uniref:Uncharacterized protein n=1 Tax=Stylosanthes scabra TaxID=79078 RepID=A0ABU6Z6V5_9FABA|nr:hypothetical protein [Stylosanthes scabra]
MGIPHFLAIPYPVQGHVNPLMQLCHVLTKYGAKVTFLNTEFNHKRTTATCGGGGGGDNPNINYVTLPDGLEPEDDRSDREKQLLSIKRTMPPLLPKLIEDVNALHDDENKISCIVFTGNMGWALEVGNKFGIKGAFLWTASATSLACCSSIPNLIHHGIIHSSDGKPTKKQEIQISPTMPTINPSDLPWLTIGNTFFPHVIKLIETMKLAEWWLCNTAYDLEPGSFISQKFLPIGPLMEINDKSKSSFWQEDTTCLEWLDQQQPQSVIYVAFGSMAVVEPNQLNELGLALDLINKPFLLVVRPSSKGKNVIPIEFHGLEGKIVSWSPQRKVLNHPSIACFISHCGWNSTMEGLCAGVPFLCWSFFADQFLNKTYICDVWRIGIELEKDHENGLILKEEIKKKVEELLGNEDIRARSMKMKELIMNNIVQGGQSSKNIQKFINWAN